MFGLFSQLPYELRRAIWFIAMPTPLQENLVFDYVDGGLVLDNKDAFLSPILHVCRESRGVALEKCTMLYGTQPVCVDLEKAIITLRRGTLWNLLTLGYIFGDNLNPVRRFAVFSSVILHFMVHNRLGGSLSSGVLVNFLAPIYKLIVQAGLQKSDIIVIVHERWNERLAEDLDMLVIENRYINNVGDLRGKFEQIVGRVDVVFEEFPHIEHRVL
jgi:hypothetical protein